MVATHSRRKLPKPGRPATLKGRFCQRCVRRYIDHPKEKHICERSRGKQSCGYCTQQKHECRAVPKSLTQTVKNLQYTARQFRNGTPGFTEAKVKRLATNLSDRMKVEAKENKEFSDHPLSRVLEQMLYAQRHQATLYAAANDLEEPEWESNNEDEDEVKDFDMGSEAGGDFMETEGVDKQAKKRDNGISKGPRHPERCSRSPPPEFVNPDFPSNGRGPDEYCGLWRPGRG